MKRNIKNSSGFCWLTRLEKLQNLICAANALCDRDNVSVVLMRIDY